MSVFVHELDVADADVLDAVVTAKGDGQPFALAALLEGPKAGARLAVFEDRTVGALRSGSLLDHSVARDARGYRGHRDRRPAAPHASWTSRPTALGRHFLVERELITNAELEALVADDLAQAQILDAVPAKPSCGDAFELPQAVAR